MGMYTLLYLKWITNKDLFCSTWNSAPYYVSLDGSGVWGRMDTCICMAESFYCPPETIKTLLIGYMCYSVMLTLCNPRDGSLPGSSVPGILQARTLEWVAISFSNA